MKSSVAARLCFGVSMGALAVSVPAFGQNKPGATPTPQTSGIEEIVVTAQRRAENLQKSSLSIEVLTAADIARAGVSRAGDLATAVPGVQIGQAGASTQIYIRGVGDYSATQISNPGVAFSVDGVYIARPSAIEGNFFDIQRVEILKGPQGTLYGRNSTGGAINVITNKPKLGVTEGAASLEVGNYDKVLGEGALNLPIGDKAALRVAGQVVDRGPYSTNNYNDDKHQSVRGQLLYEPSAKLRILVGADFIHVGGGGADFVPLFPTPGTSPWQSVTGAPAVQQYLTLAAATPGLCAPRGAPFPTSPGNFGTYNGLCPPIVIPFGPAAGTYPQTSLVNPSAGERGHTDNRFYSFYSQIDYDFGPVKLTVIPAYRHASLDYIAHIGGSSRYSDAAGGNPETSKATSLEVRLSHDSDRLKAVLGFFFFDERQLINSNFSSGLIQDQVATGPLDTRSYAGFGQATFSVTDRFRVIGGARYTYDRRFESGTPYYVQSSPFNPDGDLAFTLAVLGGCVPGPVPNLPSFIGCPRSGYESGTFVTKKVNWKAGAEYDLGPQHMLYATASTGLKAGGIGTGQKSPGVLNTYLPEDLLAYEIGSRNRFLNNMLQVNFEGFYYNYKNHQEFTTGLDNLGDPSQLINNAGKGRAYGADVDVILKPTPHDVFHVGGEYLDTKYTSFVYQIAYSPRTGPFLSPAGTGCGLTTGPGVQTVDCSGRPFTRAPKWTGVVSYAHTFGLGTLGDVTAEGNMQFQSSRYLSTEYLPGYLAPANQVYNASITYAAPGQHWSLMAYVRNIGNEVVYTGAARSPIVLNYGAASIEPPRTFGARLDYKF